MPPPDFVIVGAPKCGTTSLFGYLKQHPDIFLPKRKEPQFFGYDLPEFHRKYKTIEEYEATFADAKDEQICGEASVLYLYSQVALDELQTYNPDVKCIAIIRDPVDHFLSWHGQNVKTLDDQYSDPEEAWNAQERRKSGKDIPKNCRHPEFLQYKEFSRLGTQLKNFMEKVPENRRKIFLFDDLRIDTPKVYRETIEFLELSMPRNVDFSRTNEKAAPRFTTIEQIMRHPPYPLKLLKAALKAPLNALGIHPSKAIRKLNNKPVNTEISAEFRQKLLIEFEEEIRIIEQCLNRDLSIWRRNS